MRNWEKTPLLRSCMIYAIVRIHFRFISFSVALTYVNWCIWSRVFADIWILPSHWAAVCEGSKCSKWFTTCQNNMINVIKSGADMQITLSGKLFFGFFGLKFSIFYLLFVGWLKRYDENDARKVKKPTFLLWNISHKNTTQMSP